MLFRRPDRGRFLVPLIIICFFTASIFYGWSAIFSEPDGRVLHLIDYLSPSTSSTTSSPPSTTTASSDVDSGDIKADVDPSKYHEIYSASSPDKKYFFIDFVDRRAINPNIIPHPFLDKTWIIVAQLHDPEQPVPMQFSEITCNAAFQSGVLRCLHKPYILPVDTAPGDKCEGKWVVLNLSKGPHDARVFYGPEGPFTVFGSNSQFTCFGQFILDFRSLVYWGQDTFPDTDFMNATELQRPLPYGEVEKNWFVFWDSEGQIYAHYDVFPKRAFAKLQLDGTVGEDLAPKAREAGDEKCMEKYMPRPGPVSESIHQATNSLSVTLCKRADPGCKPNDENTFIFTIFQHKIYRYFHSVYEPYAMLFESKPPFKIHGISSKPLWVHGRWQPTEVDSPMVGEAVPEGMPGNWNQTEMMFFTSMSWKSSKQKYHGFIDDLVFVAFGIEDSRAAAIDVTVGDLLGDMNLC